MDGVEFLLAFLCINHKTITGLSKWENAEAKKASKNNLLVRITRKKAQKNTKKQWNYRRGNPLKTPIAVKYIYHKRIAKTAKSKKRMEFKIFKKTHHPSSSPFFSHFILYIKKSANCFS